MPDGVRLTAHWGDLVITTPGARYDALDVHGFVIVRAPNVTITRSIVRGGVQTGNRGLVTVTDSAARNFVIEDSELRPDVPSVWYDGIKGNNFTARRLDIHGTVDGVKIHGDNVVVEGSWIHDLSWFGFDPNQNGATHNDGVQVLGGSNLRLVGNRVEGGRNAALQVTQDYAPVNALEVRGNWMDDGDCSIKLTEKGQSILDGVALTNNRFGRDTTHAGCAILMTNRTQAQVSGNVWNDSGQPVTPRVFG